MDAPKWKQLAGTSVFNTQTESIIIDQVHSEIPGLKRWEKDDVVDLDGLESDVDEVNDKLMTDALTESDNNSPEKLEFNKEVNKTLTEIAAKLSPHQSNLSS